MNKFAYEDGTSWSAPPLASKMLGIKLDQGQGVRLETPGGGGYGDPAERDPADVALDVARGLVSAERADKDYGTGWRDHAS